MWISSGIILLSSIAAAVSASPIRSEGWFQDSSSAAARLFRRGPSDDSTTYPVGYSTPPSAMTPASWTDRLAQVVASPSFPTFRPRASETSPWIDADGSVIPNSDERVCMFTSGCINDMDIMYAGHGNIGVTFDDGPAESSSQLYDFLDQNNISDIATHFVIGSNVVSYPDQFTQLVEAGGHVAVHTWSHPYMTTLSNEAIVAELGWTMQAIIDNNGGQVPKYWRPPYGDLDNRVRMIALEVFGLISVVWNADSSDWSMATGTPKDTIRKTISDYITGDKSDGLIFLEHEITDDEVDMFIEMYPQMLSNGWKLANIADTMHLEWYQGADSEEYLQTAPVAAPSLYHAAASRPVTSATAISSTSTAAGSSTSAASSTSISSTSSSTSTSTSTSTGMASVSSSITTTTSTGSAAVATRSGRPGNNLNNTSGAQSIRTGPGLMVILGFFGVLLVSYTL